MKALVCEMCGSQDLIRQDGLYVCQSCGTKYTPDDAKKLMIEVTGTVKIDKSDETAKRLALAKRAYTDRNYAEAEKYYDLVLQEDPNNWEAAFNKLRSQAFQKKNTMKY